MYIGRGLQYQSFKSDVFIGDGATTSFQLSYNPGVTDGLDVFLSGSIQDPRNYSITSLGKLIITPAPVYGIKILVKYKGQTGTIPSNIQSLIQQESGNYVVATGSANSYIASLTPALPSYKAGLVVSVNIPVTNTGASNININGLGAINIVYEDGSTLLPGKLVANGVYEIVYDGTNFQLINPRPKFTRTVLTSGSGTYTTPLGVSTLLVILLGAGGGGSGSTSSSTSTGSAGGTTSFGSLSASGGGASSNGGNNNVNTNGGPGSGSGGDINISGTYGDTPYVGNINSGPIMTGGRGGTTPLYGIGAYVYWGLGSSGAPGSGFGSGGSGAPGYYYNGLNPGGGGCAGGYCEKLIVSPNASYSYAIGAGGAGGPAGSNGYHGGAGAGGIIIIYEYY